jgi:hypothetical protein
MRLALPQGSSRCLACEPGLDLGFDPADGIRRERDTVRKFPRFLQRVEGRLAELGALDDLGEAQHSCATRAGVSRSRANSRLLLSGVSSFVPRHWRLDSRYSRKDIGSTLSRTPACMARGSLECVGPQRQAGPPRASNSVDGGTREPADGPGPRRRLHWRGSARGADLLASRRGARSSNED